MSRRDEGLLPSPMLPKAPRDGHPIVPTPPPPPPVEPRRSPRRSWYVDPEAADLLSSAANAIYHRQAGKFTKAECLAALIRVAVAGEAQAEADLLGLSDTSHTSHTRER